MEANTKRLRYVTTNYLRLQGLRLVAVGVMLLLALPVLGLSSPWDARLFGVLMLLLGISWWRIGVYYRRRFGDVEPERLWIYPRSGLNLRVIAVLLFVLVVALVFHIKILTPECMLGLIFAGLWALEGRRWYYLLFAAPFFGVAVLYRAPHPQLWTKELWLMPLGLIVGGILDHRYLVRSLPGAQSDGNA